MATTTINGTSTTTTDRVNEHAEAEILSAVLAQPDVLRDLREGYRGEHPPLDWSHFAGKRTKPVARAMWELAQEGKPLTIGSIIAAVKNLDNAAQVVRRLDDRALPSMIDSLPLNVQEVIDLALDRQLLRDLRSTLQQAEAQPRQGVTLAQALQRRLSDISARRAGRRDHSIGAISDDELASIAIGRPIGLGFWDDPGDPRADREGMMGGLAAGEKLIIASNPGGRKTSTCVYLATQMALPLRTHEPDTGELKIIPPDRILYIMLDDTRATLKQWIVAQLASSKLIRDGADPRHYLIKSRGLHQALRTSEQHAAIQWATGLASRLPIFIMDGADDAHNFATVVEAIRHYVVNEGVTTVFIDYLQRLKVKGVKSGDIYARMDAICEELYPLFTELGSKYGAKLIATSQQSEAVNAYGATGEQGGLAGGGPLFQFANYILRTRAPANEPGWLYLRGHKMRTAQKGIEVKYQVIPSNGLITNPGAGPVVPEDAP